MLGKTYLQRALLGSAIIGTFFLPGVPKVNASEHTATSIDNIAVSTDEVSGLNELKEYSKDILQEMRNSQAKSPTLARNELWYRTIYQGYFKGNFVEVQLSLASYKGALKMYINPAEALTSPDREESIRGLWDVGPNFRSYGDDGLEGHLLGKHSSISVTDRQAAERILFADDFGYQFEKLGQPSHNFPCIPSHNRIECVIGEARYDPYDSGNNEWLGFYVEQHERLLKKIAEVRIQANEEYKETLAEVIKKLKEMGKIK